MLVVAYRTHNYRFLTKILTSNTRRVRNDVHIRGRYFSACCRNKPSLSALTLARRSPGRRHFKFSSHIVQIQPIALLSSMSAGEFRLFEGKEHARDYALYRPTYTDELYQTIFDYCSNQTAHGKFAFDFAVDIGCGSGQSTRPLIRAFKKVLGTDVSPSQIDQAKKQAKQDGDTHVQYVVGKAEDFSDIPAGSVDLITCAQSFHWFDHETFYAEARRVLKPHTGVVAVYGYGNVRLSLGPASDMVQKFFFSLPWPPERGLVTTCYEGKNLDLADFTRVDSLVICRQMPLQAFMGYVNSWSAYRTLLKENPESTALQDLQQSIVAEYKKAGENVNADDALLKVSWPLYILLGRNG